MKNASKLVLFIVLLTVAAVAGTIIISAWIASDEPVGLLPNVELASITKIEFISINTAIVAVDNPAKVASLPWQPGSNVAIVSADVNGTVATLLPFEDSTATIPKGASASFIVILQGESQFISGQEYQFKLDTTRGSTLIYTAIYSPLP